MRTAPFTAVHSAVRLGTVNMPVPEPSQASCCKVNIRTVGCESLSESPGVVSKLPQDHWRAQACKEPFGGTP